MSVENPNLQLLMDGMLAFIRLGTNRGVGNYHLEGPTNVPTDFHTFTGIYKNSLSSQTGLVIIGTDPESSLDQSSTHRKILSLSVPERIRRLSIPDKRPLRSVLEFNLELLSMPYMLLVFGEAVKEKKDVTVLYAINGISPITGLSEFQERIRIRRANFN